MISLSSNGLTQAQLESFAAAFTPEKTDHILEQVAWMTQAALLTATPKRWTGDTRRSWQVAKRKGSGGGYRIYNRSKVMIFLEKGTKAHGPVTKKWLYIPKNRKAALGGWNPSLKIGHDYILTKWVKGIKAMNIVKNQRPITRKWTKTAIRAYVTQELAKLT